MSYGPSATLLDPRLAPPAQSPSVLRILAFGGPAYEALSPASLDAPSHRGGWERLPGTLLEAEEIHQRFPDADTRVFARGDARESNYRKEAPSADINHLGCRGLIDEEQPAYTGALPSPGRDEGEDALLKAFEIAGVRQDRHPLAVLSACEVGGRRLSQSEGPLGLTRAFAEAGASAGSHRRGRWTTERPRI